MMTSTERAVLAGGCFWGIEAVYEHIARRLSHDNPVAHAMPAVAALDAPITRAFETLWPEVRGMSRALLEAR